MSELVVGDDGVERTADGRYIVVNGRRWRATDPAIPDTLRAELVSALMTGRRLVRSKDPVAREMVHDAKIALGERGDPWWEPTPEGTRARLAATVRTLLRARGEGSICPSEPARVVGAEGWRDLMDTARDVLFEQRAAGVVQIRQRGVTVTEDRPRGPIRAVAGERLARPQQAPPAS